MPYQIQYFLHSSVVIGVKLIENNKAIYSQIQVGKLLPMATVDQSSVFWLDIPSDRNFVSFDYDKHGIDFGDPALIRFTDAVVTGKLFYNKFLNFCL